MKLRKIFLLLILAVILLSGCSNNEARYRYNNLTSEQGINEFQEILSSYEVPSNDIEGIMCFVRAYSKGNCASKILQEDWDETKITKQLYDYTQVMDDYLASPFMDLNCRKAAFLVFNSFLDTPDFSARDIETEEAAPIEGLNRDKAYYACFEALFGTLKAEGSIGDTIKNYWKSQEISFVGGDVHLVSLWGRENGEIINQHCGVLFENDGSLVFFEKVDPMMPYQLSVFNSHDDLKEYLLNRIDENTENSVVFIDDELI